MSEKNLESVLREGLEGWTHTEEADDISEAMNVFVSLMSVTLVYDECIDENGSMNDDQLEEILTGIYDFVDHQAREMAPEIAQSVSEYMRDCVIEAFPIEEDNHES